MPPVYSGRTTVSGTKHAQSDTTAVEQYFRELHDIRSTGAAVPETSYYGILANLLNHIGHTLKPKVRCIIHLANRGAGIPDGGLFSANQFQKGEHEPTPGQPPERGVIEIKPASDDAFVTAGGKQVSKYWQKYGLVLVTNYRDFVLVGKDGSGNPVKLETYRLADSESEFWALARTPHKAAEKHGQRLTEYLKRVMLTSAPLASPQDVAWFLASYARDAKSRIEEKELPALEAVRGALEEALGLKFQGEKGEHFFRSTLVQTLFYGVFSAWVLWSKQNATGKFDWKQAAWSLHVPMIRALFDQVATPTKLQPLGLVEPLEWAANALNRVDRNAFFTTFDEGHAVQYFYEPFLEQFDPELRKDLGVWYTPPEIVKYMVARVDTVLREELDIEDGLADPRVYVLDPCCGTGAFLVEVIQHIADTLRKNGGDALVAQDLKRAAMERVFGFEIMPAPFVVAHLQMGLYLQNLHVPLENDSNERAAIYLTNSLTGWEPPKEPKQKLLQFPELEDERDAAEEIKREKPILVILGNPPYNAFAGVSPQEEEGLVEPYKHNLNKPESEGGWGIKKFNLDDLYIRFFRLAERRIAETSGRGVVSFISPYSWASEASFVVLRKHLHESFDKIWIENLHGNRKISEYAPDGRTSETVFAISGFSVGIQIGVTTSLWVKSGKKNVKAKVHFRDDINAARANERREQLLKSLDAKNFDRQYDIAKPSALNRFSFWPAKVSESYQSWPRIVDLCATAPSNGLMEKRGGALIDIDKEALAKRMKAYFDKSLDWDAYKNRHHELTEPQSGFDPVSARKKAQAAESFDEKRLVRYAIRPFETRWAYFTPVNPIWNRCRPTLWAQCWEGNSFIATRPAGVASPEGVPFWFTRLLGDNDFQRGHAYYFPLCTIPESDHVEDPQGGFGFHKNPVPNVSETAVAYLHAISLKTNKSPFDTAMVLWLHVLAIGFAPEYLEINADGIRQDWPRIPLPNSKKRLETSAELGKQVAALLDTESQVKGVTSGALRDEMKVIGGIARVGGGSIDLKKGELDLTAGWGHGGKGGVTMPGKGKAVERAYSKEEREAIETGAAALGLQPKQAFELLGEQTCDIYLNETANWRCIPQNVWDYTIGGYQVIKKWLSYREKQLLGRGLTQDEAREVTNMARRIAAIILMQPALDENYKAVVGDKYAWNT